MGFKDLKSKYKKILEILSTKGNEINLFGNCGHTKTNRTYCAI